jgi:prepilin-type N-terminal cleavage/methylation domain-containing protein
MSLPKVKLNRGFTLIEVVIALAVFAFLIGGLLGFLPWSVEGVSKVREQDTAYGLVDGVQVELERMGFSMVEAGTRRLDGLYSIEANAISESETKLDLLLVARKEGGGVSFEQVVEEATSSTLNDDETDEGPNKDIFVKEMGGTVRFNQTKSEDPVSLYGFDKAKNHQETFPYSNRWIPEEERYFLIKCSQFPLDHRHQHHPSNGFLGLQVDIQWPYKVPDPSRDSGFRRIPMKFRNHFRLPMAIVR